MKHEDKPGGGFAIVAELEELEKELRQLTDLSRRLADNVIGEEVRSEPGEKPEPQKEPRGLLPNALSVTMKFRERVRDVNVRLERLVGETAFKPDDSGVPCRAD